MTSDEEEQKQKEREQRFGFPVPTWSELRKILKEWGCEMVTRDAVDFFIRIIGEKKITNQMYGLALRPLINASIKYGNSIGKKRLTTRTIIDTIIQSFPSFLELEMFHVEALKNEVERGFRTMLGIDTYQELDLQQMTCLYIFFKVYHENSTELIDFFIKELPVPEIKVDYSILNSECDRLEGLENKTREDEEKIEELTEKMKIIDYFVEEYYSIYKFLDDHGTKEQIKIFEEKLWLFRLLQEEAINRWFKMHSRTREK